MHSVFRKLRIAANSQSISKLLLRNSRSLKLTLPGRIPCPADPFSVVFVGRMTFPKGPSLPAELRQRLESGAAVPVACQALQRCAIPRQNWVYGVPSACVLVATTDPRGSACLPRHSWALRDPLPGWLMPACPLPGRRAMRWWMGPASFCTPARR